MSADVNFTTISHVEDSTKFFDLLIQDTNRVYLEGKDATKGTPARVSEVVLKITKNVSQNNLAEGKILKTGSNPVWINPPQHHVYLFVNDAQDLEQDSMRGDTLHRVFSDTKDVKNMLVEIIVHDNQHTPAVLNQKTCHYVVKQ
jgi:hypothetical protein